MLGFAIAMSVSDNGLNYSINQSAREALYTPTTPDEKYKAKAFIDMFVQRFAKVLAVAINLGVTAFAGLAGVPAFFWLTVPAGIGTPAWAQAASISPEQSNASGPLAPHTYGLPSWARA